MERSAQREALVGRADELEVLDAVVAEVEAGASRVLLVSGQPGIGKSALLEALAARAADAGLRVLRGRASEQEAEVPFGLAVDALDDEAAALGADRVLALAPELGDVLPAVAAGPPPAEPPSPAQRFRYHRALRALLDELAADRPVALLLDDVHWADPGSLEWVLHLLRRPVRRAHLVVLALRPVAPLAQLLDALRGIPGARHLEPGPLADADAERLLASVADEGRRRTLATEAAGNPLFLLELARVDGTTDRLPATIGAAVELELARLDPDARRLLEGAAVAGDPFDVDLAAAAAGLYEGLGVLDRLVAADLVRPADDGRVVHFRHPLVRRAVYDATPLAARHAMHDRAATALRARGVDAPGLARHVERTARVGDAAAIATLVAAARASAARAPATAAGWLRRALELDLAAPPAARAARLAELVRVLLASGQQPEAHAALLEAIDVLGDDERELRLELVAATAALEQVLSRPEDARRRLEEAVRTLPADVPPALRARLDFELATTAGHLQDLRELDRLAGRSADALRATAPALAVADEALGAMSAFWLGRVTEAAAVGRHVDDAVAALAPGALAAHPEVHYVLGQSQAMRQELPAALATAAAGLAAVRATGNDGALVLLLGLEAQLAYSAGDARAARTAIAELEEASELQRAGYGIGFALMSRIAVGRLDGDREDLADALARWEEVRPALANRAFERAGQLYVGLVLAEEDPGRGADLALAALGPELDRMDPDSTTRQAPLVVRALLAAERADEARALAAALAAKAQAYGLPAMRAASLIAAAELHLAAERDAEAAAAAGEAGTLLAELPFGELRFQADLVAARALARTGDRQAAIDLLRAAADRASAVAAWALRDGAARELRRLGSRLPALLRVAGEDGELTDREEEIAGLVAAGRSNKEVGALLFLSPKTVEHALSRVYAKLGVRSRTELGAALRRRS